VTSQPIIDHVFVSMRRADWVQANLAAERQGSLSLEEQSQVAAWV
jgi:hypothetical protein